jgi:hypothetical protein
MLNIVTHEKFKKEGQDERIVSRRHSASQMVFVPAGLTIFYEGGSEQFLPADKLIWFDVTLESD